MKNSKSSRSTKKNYSETSRKNHLNQKSYNNNSIFRSLIRTSDNTKNNVYGNQDKKFQKEKLMEDLETATLENYNLPNQFEIAKDIYSRISGFKHKSYAFPSNNNNNGIDHQEINQNIIDKSLHINRNYPKNKYSLTNNLKQKHNQSTLLSDREKSVTSPRGNLLKSVNLSSFRSEGSPSNTLRYNTQQNYTSSLLPKNGKGDRAYFTNSQIKTEGFTPIARNKAEYMSIKIDEKKEDMNNCSSGVKLLSAQDGCIKRRYVSFFESLNFTFDENEYNKFHNTDSENISPKLLCYRNQYLRQADKTPSPMRTRLSKIKEHNLDKICMRYPDNLIKMVKSTSNIYSQSEQSKSQPNNIIFMGDGSNGSGVMNQNDISITKLSIADRTSIQMDKILGLNLKDRSKDLYCRDDNNLVESQELNQDNVFRKSNNHKNIDSEESRMIKQKEYAKNKLFNKFLLMRIIQKIDKKVFWCFNKQKCYNTNIKQKCQSSTLILQKLIKKRIYISYHQIKQFFEKAKRELLVVKKLFYMLEKKKLMYGFMSIKKQSYDKSKELEKALNIMKSKQLQDQSKILKNQKCVSSIFSQTETKNIELGVQTKCPKLYNESSQTLEIKQSNNTTQTILQNMTETGIQTESEGLYLPENIIKDKNNQIQIWEGSHETADFKRFSNDTYNYNQSSDKYLRKTRKLSSVNMEALKTLSNSPSNFDDIEVDPNDTFGNFMKTLLTKVTENPNEEDENIDFTSKMSDVNGNLDFVREQNDNSLQQNLNLKNGPICQNKKDSTDSEEVFNVWGKNNSRMPSFAVIMPGNKEVLELSSQVIEEAVKEIRGFPTADVFKISKIRDRILNTQLKEQRMALQRLRDNYYIKKTDLRKSEMGQKILIMLANSKKVLGFYAFWEAILERSNNVQKLKQLHTKIGITTYDELIEEVNFFGKQDVSRIDKRFANETFSCNSPKKNRDVENYTRMLEFTTKMEVFLAKKRWKQLYDAIDLIFSQNDWTNIKFWRFLLNRIKTEHKLVRENICSHHHADVAKYKVNSFVEGSEAITRLFVQRLDCGFNIIKKNYMYESNKTKAISIILFTKLNFILENKLRLVLYLIKKKSYKKNKKEKKKVRALEGVYRIWLRHQGYHRAFYTWRYTKNIFYQKTYIKHGLILQEKKLYEIKKSQYRSFLYAIGLDDYYKNLAFEYFDDNKSRVDRSVRGTRSHLSRRSSQTKRKGQGGFIQAESLLYNSDQQSSTLEVARNNNMATKESKFGKDQDIESISRFEATSYRRNQTSEPNKSTNPNFAYYLDNNRRKSRYGLEAQILNDNSNNNSKKQDYSQDKANIMNSDYIPKHLSSTLAIEPDPRDEDRDLMRSNSLKNIDESKIEKDLLKKDTKTSILEQYNNYEYSDNIADYMDYSDTQNPLNRCSRNNKPTIPSYAIGEEGSIKRPTINNRRYDNLLPEPQNQHGKSNTAQIDPLTTQDSQGRPRIPTQDNKQRYDSPNSMSKKTDPSGHNPRYFGQSESNKVELQGNHVKSSPHPMQKKYQSHPVSKKVSEHNEENNLYFDTQYSQKKENQYENYANTNQNKEDISPGLRLSMSSSYIEDTKHSNISDFQTIGQIDQNPKLYESMDFNDIENQNYDKGKVLKKYNSFHEKDLNKAMGNKQYKQSEDNILKLNGHLMRGHNTKDNMSEKSLKRGRSNQNNLLPIKRNLSPVVSAGGSNTQTPIGNTEINFNMDTQNTKDSKKLEVEDNIFTSQNANIAKRSSPFSIRIQRASNRNLQVIDNDCNKNIRDISDDKKSKDEVLRNTYPSVKHKPKEENLEKGKSPTKNYSNLHVLDSNYQTKSRSTRSIKSNSKNEPYKTSKRNSIFAPKEQEDNLVDQSNPNIIAKSEKKITGNTVFSKPKSNLQKDGYSSLLSVKAENEAPNLPSYQTKHYNMQKKISNSSRNINHKKQRLTKWVSP